MKKILQTLGLLFAFSTLSAQTVFINELHYDNGVPTTDANEGVEIAGPAGTDLSTYELYFYNGSSTSLLMYGSLALSGTIGDDTGCGYGFIWFPYAGIQNGSPDGLALVEGGTSVIQFLSYEGTFIAADGPAMGILSVDIGVAEDGAATLDTESLQLTGNGTVYTDFSWTTPQNATNGTVNNAQDFCAAANPTITFASATMSANEAAGTVTVTLNLNVAPSTAETATIGIINTTTTYAADYTTTPSGATSSFTLNVNSGVTSVTFDVAINDDGAIEGDEVVMFEINSTSAGLDIGGISSLEFTIIDNDYAQIPISTAQFSTGGDLSDLEGQNVKIGGIVSAVVPSAGFFIQDNAGSWNGIYIYDAGVNTVARGDSVILIGEVDEYYNFTQIINVSSFILENTGNALHTSSAITTNDVNLEEYESVLITVANGTVSAEFNAYNEWELSDGSGNAMVDDLMYLTTPAPAIGEVYNVTGPVNYSFSRFKIEPRDAADVTKILSVEEQLHQLIQLYPNPSNGKVSINYNGTATVEVYNNLGQVVLTTTAKSFELPKGVYSVNITTEKGSVNKTVIVE